MPALAVTATIFSFSGKDWKLELRKYPNLEPSQCECHSVSVCLCEILVGAGYVQILVGGSGYVQGFLGLL